MTEVVPVGRLWRASMYVVCIFVVLSGPAFLVLAHVLGASLWIGVLIGALLSLILIPVGLAMWFDVRRTARGMRRLDTAGIAGHATILSITSSSYDDRTRVALRLRVNAPGVEPFEALHTRDEDDALEVGATLGVVVDPVGHFYALT